MEITTNHHHRPYLTADFIPEEIVAGYDFVPASILEGKVWIEYQGDYYLNIHFDMLDPDSAAAKAGWEGYIEHDDYTGLVIKEVSLDDYVIGTYHN